MQTGSRERRQVVEKWGGSTSRVGPETPAIRPASYTRSSPGRPALAGRVGRSLSGPIGRAVQGAAGVVAERVLEGVEGEQRISAIQTVHVVHASGAGGKDGQELILPGNAQAYTDTPIYARTGGYLRRWYADIGQHVLPVVPLRLLPEPRPAGSCLS